MGTTPVDRNLLLRIDDLELPVRVQAALRDENITYIGDLVQMKESDILRNPNIGKKALSDIKSLLVSMGLRLGMDLPNWPPTSVRK